ncbi:MAG: acireductone synthase [Acidobacteria bacterium]|nr:MAG: acireductone synthase [Acidobacteriota bacterium]
MPILVVVCDIEGTTTSLAFVQQVLFPLSRKEIGAFVDSNWESELIGKLRPEISPFTKENVIQTLHSWIDSDLKHPVLKEIQGRIWKNGFESGEIRGHVYPDVPENFRKWQARAVRIAIFSSGSVQAQQLIFRYSDAGDLTKYIDAYFDTWVGTKKDPNSYSKIAIRLNVDPANVLFLSDVEVELDAAQTAGMKTIQVLREGVIPGKHQKVRSFDDIKL